MPVSTWSRPQKMNRFFFFLLLIFSACYHADSDPKPKLNIAVQDRYLKQLPSPFHSLSPSERMQDWGKEYQIGLGFARELDLYQAMTAFKRSEYLSPSPERKLELQYDVLLCYYLGGKYLEAIYSFENTDLRTVPPSFPAYHDLLVILYDCSLRLDQTEKAERILSYIQQLYPETAQKLALSGTLIQGDIPALEQSSNPDVQQLIAQYNQEKKSSGTAQTLNALIPGTGYLYLGQTQSAFTAFFLNGLFLWATVHFFLHGNIAAGVITASFEAGWYFGGIYGAGQEAKFYNERLYERLAIPIMNEKRLFPIQMLSHAF